MTDAAAAYDTVAASYATLLDRMVEPELDLALLRHWLGCADGPVLDAGCGTGRLAGWLAAQGADVTGIDLSPEMVAQARLAHPGIDFSVGDLRALTGSYAGVVAWYSVIHLHRAELGSAMASMAGVLRPGGVLLVAFKVGDSRDRLTRAYGHDVDLAVEWLPLDLVRAEVAAAGLHVTAVVERAPVAGERQPQGFVLARAVTPPA